MSHNEKNEQQKEVKEADKTGEEPKTTELSNEDLEEVAGGKIQVSCPGVY